MKALLAMAAALGLVLGVSPAPAQTTSRTFIESLDMGSPEAAGRLFIDAFERQDHLTMFFLLSPRAKQEFQYAVQEYRERSLFIIPPGQPLLFTSLYDSTEDMLDLTFDPALMFDAYLLAARRDAGLPFDLRGGRLSKTKDVAADGNAVYAVSGGAPAGLKIELMQMPRGNWRIERLTWTGSDAQAQPWGLMWLE